MHRLPPRLRDDLANALHPAFLAAFCVALVVWVIALRRREGGAAPQRASRTSGRGRGGRRIRNLQRRCSGRRARVFEPMAEHDFMPLDGWDHVELWVGNAKQAAFFYEHALGFTRTAYAGPETGVRDRASYVLEQGDVRLVVTSGLREDSEITRFACRHGDGAKDIALRVPDAQRGVSADRAARRHAASREPHWVEDEFGRVELSSIATYGDVVHTFVNRSEYTGPYLPVTSRSRRRTARRRRRPDEHRPRRRQRRARPHESLGRVLRARVRDDRDDPLLRRRHLDRVLGADVEGDDGRPGQDQVPDQRAGRGQAQEPDRGVPRVQPRPGRAAHRAGVDEHRRDRRGAEGARPDLPHDAGVVLRGGARARRRDRRGLRATCGGSASSPTATTTATSCRSSRRRRRTGRRSSSR